MLINEYFYHLQGKDLFVQKNHTHNEIELIHVINGGGTVLKNDRTFPLQSQYIYVIDARKVHIVYPQPDDCKEYVRNKIVIDADSFFTFCREVGILGVPERLFASAPVSTAGKPEIDELFSKVYRLCSSGKEEDKGFAHGYVLELLHWIYAHSEAEAPNQPDAVIQKMLDVIAERDSVTSLSEISVVLHMDKYYLCHLFKSRTGRTLSEYLSEKIYEKSRKLLEETTMPMEEIAGLCGFSSASSLTRFFKKKSGISPMKYRKERG